MKKNILYIGIAVVAGLLAGWLLFGNNSTETSSSTEVSDTHDHSSETAQQMWTCSMHPQIMQSEPGDCPICGMELIPAQSSAEGLAANEIKMTKNAMALANIQTTKVGSSVASDDEGMMSLSGKIAANDENNTVQSSYFDGRLEQLNISYEGQQVSRGQLLATIYAPQLVAAQQELITAASLKKSQPELYQAVRNKLKNWKLSESQINAVESSGNVRENFPVYATVSGTVAQVMAAEGDYLKQGQPILKLNNLNSVWAEFDAYESQIARLKVGQQIKVTTNAYADKEFDATVSFIDPMLNNATRTITLRATLKNTEGIFKPGMFVTGKLKGEINRNDASLTVPASAVMWTGERSLVYIKTNPNEPVFEMREVSIGSRSGENYTITAGLQNGDEIVTNGTFTVDAAAQLQGKNSMMNQGKQEVSEVPLSEMKMKFSESFQKDFKKVLQSYLQMKDAFVNSDAEKVSAFAKATSKSLKAVAIGSLGQMEQSHIKKSIEMLNAIAKNENLENQRDHFVVLNENMVVIAMNVEGASPIYVQKCPMANNNKGAVWLSTEKDIKNPYYGDAMLTCGSVIEEIN
ncbi:efflux RND transporter periplasmic adaptor subunit [Nonlabens sp. MB-3u-79]|uniref:efflux RND transporter periplasmic adaptor subunit n=1 Tax=Nonlabens sp. MB-3u-79 TaxID=2058134 RepID=UPI000C305394|nr:efflux RND transporter periplasmic adaptor subunit [Nonlabens sp. MB-3u-79]AUC79415.1 efflux RND transporter periplasmic adaptor subunit [Nonlabens sp. MB-3u-79]